MAWLFWRMDDAVRMPRAGKQYGIAALTIAIVHASAKKLTGSPVAVTAAVGEMAARRLSGTT